MGAGAQGSSATAPSLPSGTRRGSCAQRQRTTNECDRWFSIGGLRSACPSRHRDRRAAGR
eukprot:scaffold1548_cov117-Isochrysis_galbana.AAC.2